MQSLLIAWYIFIVAKHLQQHLSCVKIIHLIADLHALESMPASAKEKIQALARDQRELVSMYAERLGLGDSYEVVLASDLDQDPHFRAALKLLVPEGQTPNYETRESAEIEFFRVNRQVRFKISWTVPGPKRRWDERSFDELYEQNFGKGRLSFIYTGPGYTFDSAHPIACPYILLPEERRIVFERPAGEEERQLEGQVAEEEMLGEAEELAERNRRAKPPAKVQALRQLKHILKALEDLLSLPHEGSSIERLQRVRSTLSRSSTPP